MLLCQLANGVFLLNLLINLFSLVEPLIEQDVGCLVAVNQ